MHFSISSSQEVSYWKIASASLVDLTEIEMEEKFTRFTRTRNEVWKFSCSH